jgi:hypothetical protein
MVAHFGLARSASSHTALPAGSAEFTSAYQLGGGGPSRLQQGNGQLGALENLSVTPLGSVAGLA